MFWYWKSKKTQGCCFCSSQEVDNFLGLGKEAYGLEEEDS